MRNPNDAAVRARRSQPADAADVFDQLHPRRWAALYVLLAANFMTMLDLGIINVALPSVRASLQADARDMQWFVEVYILAYALGLLPFGRLGDIAGHKTIFLVGVSVFACASGLCGFANSPEMLIGARVLQGLGSAMISPQVMAVARSLFPPQERARAFSSFGRIAGLAAILGPVVSGFLIQIDLWDLGWRLVFLINLPLAVVTLAAAAVLLPKLTTRPELGNDWLGIALAGSGILCLVVPLVEGRVLGWPLWCIALIVVSGPLLVAFVVWEHRQERMGRSALLPAYLLRDRDYLLGVVALMVFFSSMQAFFVVFAIFLQYGLKFSAFDTGLATAPFPVGILFATTITGRVASIRAKVAAGSGLLIVADALLWRVVHHASLPTSAESFVAPLLVGGLGAGICISALFQNVMTAVPIRDTGSGSGAAQVVQQIGGALGVALVSGFFFWIATPGHTNAGTPTAFREAFAATMFFYVAAHAVVGVAATKMRSSFVPSQVRTPRPSST